MGQKVPDGRRSGGRTELVRPGRRVEGFEHAQVCKLRQIFLSRVVETQSALFHELHQSKRCDRLGHRGNAKHGIGRQRTPRRDIRDAERTLIKDALAIRDQRNHARHVLALNRATQTCVDGGGPRILRVRSSGKRGDHDAEAEANSSDFSIHESLPLYMARMFPRAIRKISQPRFDRDDKGATLRGPLVLPD